MRPIVDREACIGCMLCEGNDPVVFKVIDGKSEVQDQDAEGNGIVFEDHKDSIEKAIRDCPVSAISWGQESGAELMENEGLAEDPTVDTIPAEEDMGMAA